MELELYLLMEPQSVERLASWWKTARFLMMVYARLEFPSNCIDSNTTTVKENQRGLLDMSF
jgi:hypothetical protein